MTNLITSLTLHSEADTKRLARSFASHMQAGDVLILSGGLAAGKTFFVRAAVNELGSMDAVSSPTYTLANMYSCPIGPIIHMDAYRLESPADFADLALEDEFERGVAFIEWGEMLKQEFDDYIVLDLAFSSEGETTRIATLTSTGQRGAALLAGVLKDFAS